MTGRWKAILVALLTALVFFGPWRPVGATNQVATPQEALDACNGVNGLYESCQLLDNGELEIKLIDPPVGQTYEDNVQGATDTLRIPTGYCYIVDKLSVHVTTSATGPYRNFKVVERDTSIPPGSENQGVAFGVAANGVMSNNYVDFSEQQGLPYAGAVFKAGVGQVLEYNLSSGAPTTCVPDTHSLGVSEYNRQPGDAWKYFVSDVIWNQP